MKYFITGLHSSGKQAVVDALEKMGVKCGKLFTNYDINSKTFYNKKNYEMFENEDVADVFENNAYIFMHEYPKLDQLFNTGLFYEGLTKYSFDQNDVFILNPNQVLSITPNAINEDICFVWLDNTKDNRTARYHSEKRLYNYNNYDLYEKRDINAYVKTLYTLNNSSLIYFTNEEPCRVASIIYTMITHPDTVEMFLKNFD